jgi:hypothetical protein
MLLVTTNYNFHSLEWPENHMLPKILLVPTALTVLYKAQKHAWINSEVFQGWFFNKFLHYPTYSVRQPLIGHI